MEIGDTVEVSTGWSTVVAPATITNTRTRSICGTTCCELREYLVADGTGNRRWFTADYLTKIA